MTKTYPAERIPELLEAFYQATAKTNGWRLSPAYGGWINDDYWEDIAGEDDGDAEREVQPTASDVCFVHDLLDRKLEPLLLSIENNAKAIAALNTGSQP